MNHTDKASRKSGRRKNWLLVLASVAIAATVIGIGLSQRKSTGQTELNPGSDLADETEETLERSTEVSGNPAEDLLVETPFCTLHYPGKWGDAIRTESDDLGYGYAVRFYGTRNSGTKELFSILFGYSTENAVYVGTFMRNNISTDVYVEKATFAEDESWTAEDTNELRAMQTDADYVIEKLMEDPFFDTSDGKKGDIEIPTASDAVVDTPYALLYYPAQWKDALRWEAAAADDDGYVVTFYGTVDEAEVPLFAFHFQSAAEDGFQVGTVQYDGNEVGVYLALFDAPSENHWTDTQQHLFAALQEQAYYVLDKLAEDPNYSSVID